MPNLVYHTYHQVISNYTTRIVCTCTRMEDGKKAFKSSRTNREYKITRHYTCESSHLVYLVKCDLCKMDYVGQTTQTMRSQGRDQEWS